MSIELLELAATALAELCEEVVFVGGATVALWITLVDGRAEIQGEVAGADLDVRTYLREELSALMDHALFDEGIAGSLPGYEASQRRADIVVKPRIQAIIDA